MDKAFELLQKFLKRFEEQTDFQSQVLSSILHQSRLSILLLEQLSKNVCKSSQEVCLQTQIQEELLEKVEALLGIYKSSHPGEALNFLEIKKLRKELEECCKEEKEDKYKDCYSLEKAGENKHEGKADARHAKVKSKYVEGAPYKPDDCGCADKEVENDEMEFRQRKVPTGAFKGYLLLNKSIQPLSFKDGGALDDNPDPVIFGKYQNVGTVVNPLATNNAADICGSDTERVVLLGGNRYLSYSTDGGSTFTRIDPKTIFPNDAGGFCCDQVIQYVPSIDRFIWLLQYFKGADGKNIERLAAASPEQIISSNCTAWTYWDLTSDTFGLGANWMDFPDMSVGNNSLYISFDEVNVGLMVLKIPLNEIRDGSTINFSYTDPANGANVVLCHITQNTADEVFWAGHKDNSTMQVFSWREDSGTYFWRDVSVRNWPNNAISSVTPSGTDWLSTWAGTNIIGATRKGDELWFAWTASSGDGGHGGFNYPHPHVQIAKIRKNDFTLIDQPQIWNNDHAYAYPTLITNLRNEVASGVAWGGNLYEANSAFGIIGDYVVYYNESSTTSHNRWGDYITVRQSSPDHNLFAGFGYAILLDTTTPNTLGYYYDPFYVQFGRKSLFSQIDIIR